jgi:hypothetical protein
LSSENVATHDRAVSAIVADVSQKYRRLKETHPSRRIEFSSLILEVVKSHGFREPEEISLMRAKVGREFARRRVSKKSRTSRGWT